MLIFYRVIVHVPVSVISAKALAGTDRGRIIKVKMINKDDNDEKMDFRFMVFCR